MRTISTAHLNAIRMLTTRRDQNARAIGIAYVEFEIAKAKLLTTKAPDMLTRLGAACVELESYRNQYLQNIAADMKSQEEVAAEALRSVGIDVTDKSKTHTIDLETGRVKVLRDQQWVNEE